MMDAKTRRQLAWECEDEILKLIDDADELTRSDLQGCVGALVSKLMSGIEAIIERDRTGSALHVKDIG